MNKKNIVGTVLTALGVLGIGYAVKKTYHNVLEDRKRFIQNDNESNPVGVKNCEPEQTSEMGNNASIVRHEPTTECQVSQETDLLTKVRVAQDIGNYVVMPTINMLVKALVGNQTFFYGCTNKNGYVTGFGYVFETIICHSTINGDRPVKQADTYRGADFQVGKKRYQAKCCCSQESYERGLFDNNGNYKYGKQDLIVPKGDKEKVLAILLKHGVHREIVEMNVSYEQVRAISELGKWAGVKFDLVIGLRSMWVNMTLLLGKGLLYEVLVTEVEYILNKGRYPDREVKRNYRFKRWGWPALGLVGGSLLTYAGFGQFCRIPHLA